MPEQIIPYSVSTALSLPSKPINLTHTPLDVANRYNRSLPIDAATQNFTLHLYNTAQSRRLPARPRPEPGSPLPPHGEDQGTEEDEDEDDDVDYLFGRANMRRGAPREDTSLKKIKNVQGVDGRWTITDCDADKKADKCVFHKLRRSS